jgi:hypothetical protein
MRHATYAELSQPDEQPARTRLFWLVLGTVAAAQLVAFWLLCSHQVRKAEARNTAIMVQQLALQDCLQYIPGSTIASCSSRMDVQRAAATRPATATMGAGAMPVSFVR